MNQENLAKDRFRQKFDDLLARPLDAAEPVLSWALGHIASNDRRLDWVQMTNDLSRWERETTRLQWAKQYLQTKEREHKC